MRPELYSETNTRITIFTLYVNMGMPPSTKWDGPNGTASKIRRALGDGDNRMIKRTLDAALKAIEVDLFFFFLLRMLFSSSGSRLEGEWV